MPDVLSAFMAFAAEHQRCGDLDGGGDNGYVWLQCSCGGLIMQPEKEPPHPTASQCEGAGMPRRPPPSKPPRPLPEEMAKDAIAHEEAVGGDKVWMTFRVILGRQQAEALAARAIREEKNIGALVTEIIEAAVNKA